MRQAMLVKNIFNILNIYDKSFIKKCMFAAAFQRSGRESELGNSNSPDLYHIYELNDVINFKIETQKYSETNCFHLMK